MLWALRLLRELSMRKDYAGSAGQRQLSAAPRDHAALHWDTVSVRHLAALAVEFATAQPQPKTLIL